MFNKKHKRKADSGPVPFIPDASRFEARLDRKIREAEKQEADIIAVVSALKEYEGDRFGEAIAAAFSTVRGS